jgi:hypothetical protein
VPLRGIAFKHFVQSRGKILPKDRVKIVACNIPRFFNTDHRSDFRVYTDDLLPQKSLLLSGTDDMSKQEQVSGERLRT